MRSDPRYEMGPPLFRDDFAGPNLGDWVAELEAGGTVAVRDNRLVVDVPQGATVWFRHELVGPLLMEYDAVAVAQGGPNDRVSDLNCFWMAREGGSDARRRPVPEARRSGRFADYDSLRCYYVGLGGNGNTTTRFRRYIGEPGNRPLLPEHDLSAPEFLLRPNIRQTIRLVACGPIIQYWRDGARLFELRDQEPYERGWFGLRTVASHLEIRNFRVHRLKPTG